MRIGSGSIAAVLGLGHLALQLPAFGQAESQKPPAPAGDSAATATDAPSAPTGLLPIPDYTGDLWTRRYLLGDWDGSRTDLANKGIQFQIDWTQVLQGVVDGGRDQDTRSSGNFDYLMYVDLMRMGILPGALLKIRAESRYGETANGIAGPILPVNTDGLFPLTDDPNDGIPFTITNVLFTQYLSEKFAVFLGKLDTLDGDPNEFAGGRGTSQFMNSNFVFNPALALRLPYSTLGAGVVWAPANGVMLTSSVVNTADSSTTTGFEDFGDGGTWTTEADFQYTLGTLPGGQNVGFLYSFDQNFRKINGRFVFQPGEGLVAPTEDETWAVYWSGWQYLWVEDPREGPINLLDGMPDHQGVGLFARAGFADQDTNPVEWAISAGLGGRGIIPSRDNDSFGIGYYYTRLQTSRVSGITGVQDEAQGFEAYYTIALTPAAHLTIDVQVVESPSPNLDTGVVVGARVGLRF